MLTGRVAEQRVLAGLLEGARRSTSGVLVVRGEAGVGKTALLADLVASAGETTVLTCRGVEPEAELPYAALHRLLLPVLAAADRLPAPQADALRAAFGLARGSPDDRFLVSLAVLTLLGELGEERPVLCVVDDAHWLDGASAAALGFVARRLAAEAVAMVFGVRSTETARVPLADLPALDLGGLDLDAVRDLLAASAGEVHPDVAARLLAATGGNPLALVELLRALDADELAGLAPLPAPLPLTRGVEQAFLERVRRLPADTQTVLLVAAADDTGRLPTVLGAAGAVGVGDSALVPAEEAGVLRVDHGTVEFRHPLVRSAIYQGATSTARRTAHRALAGALDPVTDADRRAWHRAAATVEPDEQVAAELHAAAVRARDRGALTASAAAEERAAQLTADPTEHAHRLTAAARDLWRLGQGARAAPLLTDARTLATDVALRTTIDELRGLIELGSGEAGAAYRILRAAAERIVERDPTRALELLALAGEAASLALDVDGEVALGELAERLDAGSGVRERFLVDLLVGLARQFAGDPAAAAAPLRAAVDAARSLSEPHLLLAAGRAAMYLGDDAAALRFSAAVVARARDAGEVAYVPIAGPRLALSELFTGRWTAAVATATDALELARATHQTELTPHGSAWLGLAAALRGEEQRCRELIDETLAMAGRHPMGLIEDAARWSLSVLDLGLGDPVSALGRLREVRHPVVLVFSSLDRVEAAHHAGDDATAQRWLASLEIAAERTGQPWALARAAHGRALLGPPEELDRHFTAALRHHERSTRPFERARTELAYGAALRRARRRADARPHLRAAYEQFEALGAAPWADRAHAELRASGQTVQRRVAGGPVDRLTPQEVQVARFVARGLTNAEVAAQLFLSRRTVDFHLRNVFSKLGITSRTELVRFVVEHE